ncbi:MAG: von Willebrand factor type A domain-containing protein [Kofleriaceae bacterium]|nr:von Willebrand factor type A domain-containing protein [Kofleriaceae bacterium]
MRHVRSIALVLLSACASTKSHRYVAATEAAAPPYPSVTVARAEPTSGEQYTDWGQNPWVDASEDHLSTFAADVDTASYTLARRKLQEGTLPQTAAIRVEEFVNYFNYTFPPPASGTPFSVVMDAAPSPLAANTHILRVGVATRAKAQYERKPANLVFLVDVSGSMSGADRLGLAQQSLRILTENLGPRDSVSLVTYAGSTRVVLPPTGMENRDRILAAIDELSAGGSTAMASGLDLAYEQAMKGLLPGTISRVIVLSDGDANVGPAGHEAHLRIIGERAKAGVTLSTIGFGTGNYKDTAMEQLANRGNGNNYYVDSAAAAKKIFSDQLGSTLEVVAKDAKLQVDFDPNVVAKYRLVGYENRTIRDEQFRDDKVDAGEIGAGHQVTAMYEVQLTAKAMLAPSPLGVVRIRHKAPDGDRATEATFPMTAPPVTSFDKAAPDFKFAFAVAAFADVLRGADEAKGWSLGQIAEVARSAQGDDKDRAELVSLIERARTLRGPTATVAR